MTRDEFVLVYTRFHFDIYKNADWEVLKLNERWLKVARQVTSFKANELFNYLVAKGELKDTSSKTDKSCETCRTKNVCTFRNETIYGKARQFCSEYEKE